MKKIYSFLLPFLIFATVSFSQDIHYTQFYNSPLTLSPALTGLTEGSFRATAIYRNQWFSVSPNSFGKTAFGTPSVSIDAPIRFGTNAIGLGAYFMNDQAGANTFNTFSGALSVSYIKSFNSKGTHQLSLGFQGGYSEKRLNLNELQLTSQFQDNTFNSNLPTNLNFSGNKVGTFDLHFGLLWYSNFTEHVSWYVGGALFNSIKPKESILTGGIGERYIRFNIHSGFDFLVGKRIHILPSGMFMRQSTADELVTGIALGVDLNSWSKITFGGYNRVNQITTKDVHMDAAIAYFGVEIKGFQVAASYDFTVYKLKDAGNTVGALELSLKYVLMGKQGHATNVLFCPRF